MRPIAAFAALLLLVSAPALARDLDGVNIPDRLIMAGENAPLLLNGAGYRKKFFIKVYIGALYLAQPANQARAVLDAGAARVMRMHFLRDVGQDQFAAAWNDGIAANHTATEMQALRARIDQLSTLVGSVRHNDVLRIDMRPRGDTEVWLNDKLRSNIGGVDFQNALLTAWVGAKPADANLKHAVLGGKE
ncbi:MAG TPA: chalcone isomerase family protein [Acidiferrobacterales bacterium]|nr:chalcone isomerase family protein [Acidiferrobacterales bacterium]